MMSAAPQDPTVGRFTSDAARKRFEKAYRDAMRLWPTPRTEVDVETSFGTTHIHRFGAETGVPAVLLPGSGSNSTQWFPNVAALGKDRPVYSIDTLGDPGLSDQRLPIHEPAKCAAWLDEVLSKLALRRVHLVGHSYGGWIALNQMVHRSDRLASTVLIDPGGLSKVGARFLLSIFISVVAGLAPRWLRPYLARRLHNPVLLIPELMAVIFAGAGGFRTRRPAPDPVTNQEFRAIRTPMLIVLGEKSTLHKAREVERRVTQLQPTAIVEIMADTGHGPTLEKPEEINRLLTNYLTKVDQRLQLSAQSN